MTVADACSIALSKPEYIERELNRLSKEELVDMVREVCILCNSLDNQLRSLKNK